MLARRLGNEAALDFLRWGQRGGFTLYAPTPDAMPDTFAQVLLISERFRDLPFDLADASVAEAAARNNVRHVLTIDSDFDVYRDAKGKALRHVLRQQPQPRQQHQRRQRRCQQRAAQHAPGTQPQSGPQAEQTHRRLQDKQHGTQYGRRPRAWR